MPQPAPCLPQHCLILCTAVHPPQDDADGDIYAKYDPRLHGKKRADGIRPLKPGCLRKFVINLRKRYDGKSKVELTPAAVLAMRDFYIELRSSAKDRWAAGAGVRSVVAGCAVCCMVVAVAGTWCGCV